MNVEAPSIPIVPDNPPSVYEVVPVPETEAVHIPVSALSWIVSDIAAVAGLYIFVSLILLFLIRKTLNPIII